uniref:Outer envelope pore protein 37, chloroplastic n=1 Tax=Populus davidiana TaxID=266767 RepID=A0A6M2EAS3_9ROSI
MAESSPPAPLPPSPNHMVPPIPHTDPPPPPPPPPPPRSCKTCLLSKRPKLRVTSEFDSDTSLFFHKVSCKLLDSFAKFKLSFQNNNKVELSQPQFAFTSKLLSIHYDLEEHNALVKGSFDLGPNLHFKAAHDVKAQQGEVAMIADLGDPGYALQISSPVPTVGVPRATLKFPLGEVSLEEKEEEELRRTLSVSGVVKSQLMNGLCTAQFSDEDLKLRYCYKDEALSIIPSISLPSNALSFAFKRRFTPSNKLSYWYNFDTNNWSTVYKHTYGKDFKFKAGYDSEVRLGWASLWVGDEGGNAKTAPMKMKVQFMLQVPQDDIKTSALMFRVKKRWDI